MNVLKRACLIGVLFLSAFMCSYSQEVAYGQIPDGGFSESGGGYWSNVATIKTTEPMGFRRENEPVEVTLVSDQVKPQGEDIRISDSNHNEIPCQVSVAGANNYKVCFFVQADPNSSSTYYLFFGNPNAGRPNYGVLKSILDSQTKTWQTEGVLVQWNGKAGYSVSGTNAITTLKFDSNGDGNPGNDPDCLPDAYAWNWFYGFLGSRSAEDKPAGFGLSQAQIIENGPIFSELMLGNAKIRYYKGQKWIATNQYVQSMVCYDPNYQSMKCGLGNEMLIPNLGSGDIQDYRHAFNSASVNPQFLAFRNPTNGLVFGSIAINVAQWYMGAKCSGAWSRAIYFEDSSNRPDAKIYWYADTSNNYDGIDKLSKQVLNPLQVQLIMDTEPPTTNISISPAHPDGQSEWFRTQPQVILSASEPGTTYYRINDGETVTYSEPITMPEGINSLKYYSVDTVGNGEPEKSLEFKVDCSQPAIEASLLPVWQNNRYLINELITLSYDATDAISGINSASATLDSGTILNGAQRSFSKPGEHLFTIIATDTAGNVASTTRSFTVGYNLRWKPPVKRIGDLADSPYYTNWSSAIPIRFAAYDGTGKFIIDKSVIVAVSDGTNTAIFAYGKDRQTIRINPCDQKYILDVDAVKYPWLKPGGSYTVSVYFGGLNQYLGVLHGQIGMELI